MFRRLNKSAIWLLCQCANHWLWNLSKWPFTGAVLQSTSPSNPSACPSSMGGPGYAGGWSVGWWYQISHAIQARRFIHFGDVHSKQWAALIASSLSAYIVWSFGQVIDLNYYVCYSSSASGNLPRVVLFVNNHKNRNRPWTAVFIKKPTETCRKYENGNRHSTRCMSDSDWLWNLSADEPQTTILVIQLLKMFLFGSGTKAQYEALPPLTAL